MIRNAVKSGTASTWLDSRDAQHHATHSGFQAVGVMPNIWCTSVGSSIHLISLCDAQYLMHVSRLQYCPVIDKSSHKVGRWILWCSTRCMSVEAVLA